MRPSPLRALALLLLVLSSGVCAADRDNTAVLRRATLASESVRIRRSFADVRTGQLHVRRAGRRDAQESRTAVVLLHQTPLSGRMFTELLPALAVDRVVYAPDTPGYGESSAPVAVPSIADYADALHDWIAELKQPVDLVGYHTGVLIAVEIAARYPKSVRRLLLMSVPLLSAEQLAALGEETPLHEDGRHLIDAWNGTMRSRPPEQSLDQVARIVAEKQRAGRRSHWAMLAIKAYDAQSRLRAIAHPVIVVRLGDSLAAETTRAAELIPGALRLQRDEWSQGLFDVHAVAVAAMIRGALDAQPRAGAERPSGERLNGSTRSNP